MRVAHARSCHRSLNVSDVPIPKVGAREVLIAIDTAGVGIWDARDFEVPIAADAHRRVEKGHLLGKIVLRISASSS